MSMKDNLYIGKNARNKLMKGVMKSANAIGVTLGTAGSNSLISCLENPHHFTTNDGATILGSIKLADPLEEMGRMVLYEAVNRANRASGDGSSTTAVLTSAILEEGLKYIGKTSPMEIKRSLEACLPQIEAEIKAQAQTITIDNVAPVASISAEDESIGNMIQTIYQEIGKDGVIQWDISKTAQDSYQVGSGLTIAEATYVSPYMCDIDANGNLTTEVRWTNPTIMLTKQKITTAADFNGLFQELYNQDIREVVIFCEDIEVPVVADLIRTRAIRGFKTVVIKLPVLWRDEWWEDLALASGATVITPTNGISLSTATQTNLGKFAHITITKEATHIDGINDLTQHILNLQAEGSDAALNRIVRLNTRTARYFVGAQSESALAYKRLKVEDAINAAACALTDGIVPGGGIALFNAAKSLPKDTVGGKILKQALKAPLQWIISNAGWLASTTPTGPLKMVYLDGLEQGQGFNSKTEQIGDMLAMGIVDPTTVVLNAIKNAIGVAASILTIGSVVTLPEEKILR